MANPVQTLVIDNFNGSMSLYPNGDINSGKSFMVNQFGQQPVPDGNYGNLTWVETGVQIDAAGAVITDLIMDGKERVESGIIYVYAIGHTGRVYKIQVNNPATFNPDYDNPVLLTTLTINSPTFTRGGFIDFYGTTERMYIGHDKGVTQLNFDGSSETFVGAVGTWTQNVPRPIHQFVGKMYVGNGPNIAEIDSTLLVTNYTKLSPGFPSNTQVRDLDVSVDGTYLHVVVTSVALPSLFAATQDVTPAVSADSYIFRWNGIDVGYTSYTTYPSFTLNSNIIFGDQQYTFGYDQYGMAIFNPTKKIISQSEEVAPMPNAIASTGNIVTWMAPLFYVDHQEMTYGIYGSQDFEMSGFWSPFGQLPTGTETDVTLVPWQLQVTNFGAGSSSNGYANNIYSYAKIYYSQLETSSAPTTKYKLYKWSPGEARNSVGILNGAIYQTQSQVFSKKIIPQEVRIYGSPWEANVAFQIDLIGSGSNLVGMTGGTKVFTAGSNLTIGADFASYTPTCAPTYVLGILITTVGTANFVISKIEIDYVPAGK